MADGEDDIYSIKIYIKVMFTIFFSGGGSLPTQCAPTSSTKKKPASAPKKESKVLNAR